MATLQDFLDADYSWYDGGEWAMSYHTVRRLQGLVRARVEKADALKKAAELVHEQCNVSGDNVSHHAWIDLDDALRAYEATKEDGGA